LSDGKGRFIIERAATITEPAAAMFGGDIKAAFSNWINTLSGRIIALAHHQAKPYATAPHNIKSTSSNFIIHITLSAMRRK
jgi:hypothetical protein